MKIHELIPDTFNGVVSITRNDTVIFQESYGYADLPNLIPNELDTRFPTASAGKVFVATAILQFIHQNRISFTSTIGELLSFDLRQINPNITVRQLLNHTSGIPDYFDESVMTEYAELWEEFPNYKVRTSSDLLPLFIEKPMMYTPGEKFQYNNSGYVVLGLIIETVTGKPFDEYLRDHVFNPSGMLGTGYFELDRLPAKCANAYIYDKEKEEYYTNIYSVDAKGTGAGGAFTTVGDCKNFWKNLLQYHLLPTKMVQEMMSPQVEKGCYGYGLWVNKKENKVTSVHFEGCDPGVSFLSTYIPEKEIVITTVSNMENNVWKLQKDIQQLI